MGTVIPDWEKLNPTSLPRAHHHSLLLLFGRGGSQPGSSREDHSCRGSPSPRSCLLQPGKPSLDALGLGRFHGVTKHPESKRWELSLGTGQSQELMANLSRGVRPSPRPSRGRHPPGSMSPALRRGFLHTDLDPGTSVRRVGRRPGRRGTHASGRAPSQTLAPSCGFTVLKSKT